MANSTLAAVIQLCSRQDVADNLRRAAALVAEAAGRGAGLVVLPENFGYIHSLREKLDLAEPLSQEQPGPMVAAMITAAREHGVYLLIGGTPTRGPDPEHFYTTSILLDPAGTILASYRKMHLFDVKIPRGAMFTESDWVAPGADPVVADLPGFKLGLSICYDLRFPELYRRLVELGATVLAVPAAFTLHTGKDHWLPLLRARAIENQCYVLAAGQHGHHTEERTSYGKSCIIDPWGVVVAQASDQDGVALAELDLDYLERVRRELPCLSHRRV